MQEADDTMDLSARRLYADGDRVIEFSQGPAYLSLRDGQILIRRDGLPDMTTPVDEAAVVVLSSRRVTCTVPVLDALVSAGCAVLICDEAMKPSGLMLPLAGHFQQTRRMIAQATAKVPLKKQIWRQIVVAKVRAQAANLLIHRGTDGGLNALAATVRSGDPMNIEAQAAQRYWPLLFNDPDFLRRRDAPDQNRMLNFGYAVLRAAVGRALVVSGLHPSLGVHHHGRTNPFCLADDLMEPYRPLIDGVVAEITGEWGADVALDPTIKGRIIGTLHERLTDSRNGTIETRTTFEWISRSAASLARTLCRERKDERLFFPTGLTNS